MRGQCLVLYIEYMSVSIFISGIAHTGGTECEDPVDVCAPHHPSPSRYSSIECLTRPNGGELISQCVQSIGMGLAVYSAGVGYFAL